MMGKLSVCWGLWGRDCSAAEPGEPGRPCQFWVKAQAVCGAEGRGAAVEEAAETLLRWKRRLLPCWSVMGPRQRRVFRLLPDLNLKRLLLMLTS